MFNKEIIKELTSLGSCPHEPSKINLAAEVREDKNLGDVLSIIKKGSLRMIFSNRYETRNGNFL